MNTNHDIHFGMLLGIAITIALLIFIWPVGLLMALGLAIVGARTRTARTNAANTAAIVAAIKTTERTYSDTELQAIVPGLASRRTVT
jgi:hypothetical protein